MTRKDIKSISYEELSDWIKENNYKKFRTDQIFSWLHEKNVVSFEQMKNVSKQIIQQLNTNFYINNIKIKKKLVSSIDGTVKYLYMLEDGECIESVVMEYAFGRTICISSQVGCKMGCSFCASGKSGYIRNLTTSEMLDQLYTSERDLNCNIGNIVLMGIGEPLDNYDNFIKFIKNVSNPKGRNLGLRHITVSTCGLVDKIDKLADENISINLSISLHAPNDMIRRSTMPVAKKWNIDRLLSACRRYTEKTHRRITFEYVCIDKVNVLDEHAIELAGRLKDMLCHVNLIPINPISEESFSVVEDARLHRFFDILKNKKIPVTIRRTLGQDVNASCGQLRGNYLDV